MWIQSGISLNILVLAAFLRPVKLKGSVKGLGKEGKMHTEKSLVLNKNGHGTENTVLMQVRTALQRTTGCRLGGCVCDVEMCVGTVLTICTHHAILTIIIPRPDTVDISQNHKEIFFAIYGSLVITLRCV